eukprot:gene8922-18461_t
MLYLLYLSTLWTTVISYTNSMSRLDVNENTSLISYRDGKNFYVHSSEAFVSNHNSLNKKSKGVLVVTLALLCFILSIVLISSSPKFRNQPLMGIPIPVSRVPIKVVAHTEIPSAYWGAVTKPYPTGAFWTNLVIRNGDGPIGVLPYGIKCVDAGVQVSYGPTRRIITPAAIFDPFVTDLQISSTQGYLGRGVDTYDNSSVTMSYRTAANGKFRTHLVKGSPFVTVVYEGATPIISANSMQILNVEARVVKGSVGIQYIITLGNYQKWLVYCSEPVAFIWKDNTLTAPSAIRGMVRVAILPSQNSDTAFNFLLGYIQRYPTGVQVSLTYPTATTMSLNYQYLTQGAGPLLMMALPHQLQVMSNPDSDETRAAQTIYTPIYSMKGKMKAIVGDSWKLTYTLVNIGWNYAVADKLSNSQLDVIAFWLQQEVKIQIPSAQDTYGFGKELGRMARLALIADNLGIADARQIAITNLENSLNPWIQCTNPNPFVYDRIWGGVISTHGLVDPNAEFGLGWYNDHHFHYGYFIYAFATLARLDPSYVESRKPFMELLVRDICSYDPTDVDFPMARHKDFFDGHSWASGLFNQGNGKNQESSSEAVNAYYACYLYGLATSNVDLTNFGHSLLTMEIQSAQVYWHMGADSTVYDDVFKVSRMAGNVGALDVTASTWFGSAPEYVHGIN